MGCTAIVSKFKPLDKNEALFHVIEEAGEVLQCAGKIQRFGWNSSHPKYGNTPNYELIYNELSDLISAAKHLQGFIEESDWN